VHAWGHFDEALEEAAARECPDRRCHAGPRCPVALRSCRVALCHQLTTLEREKLVAPLGVLPTDPLRDVERGIKAALDLGGVMP
jgi:hypothetical protein